MKTQTTPDQEYRGKKKEVEILLTKIKLAIESHSKRQADHRDYWGYIGDLEHALKELGEVNKFLRGKEAK